jgi:5-methylcytosine-specific restriction endonuclease McrA
MNGHTYLGAPCKRGHSGLRYASTAACVMCAKLIRYPDRTRAQRKARARMRPDSRLVEYRNAKRQRMRIEKELTKLLREVARLAVRLRQHSRALAHDPALAARIAGLAAYHRRMALDPEGERLRQRARRSRRRARLRGARVAGAPVTAAALALLWEEQGGCAYCGATAGRHLDHMTPLARGGAHSLANLQWLCGPCNMRKHTMTDEEARRVLGVPTVTRWDAI